MMSKEGEIRRDEACLDYSGNDVILYPCHGSGGNQMWFYDMAVRDLLFIHDREYVTFGPESDKTDCSWEIGEK